MSNATETRQTAPELPQATTTAITQPVAPQVPSATPKIPKALQWKGNPKQKAFMAFWTSPSSATFGNITQSALKAGYKPSYARNLVALAPSWLEENIEVVKLQEEHITQGIQQIAISAPNSRSPDDTRLKAYETLAKITGMLEGNKTTVTIVQPILGGASVAPRKVDIEQG